MSVPVLTVFDRQTELRGANDLIVFPGVLFEDRTHHRLDGRESRMFAHRCVNTCPRCPDDLVVVDSVGLTVIDSLNNLRNWVDYYHSYDHCLDPLPPAESIASIEIDQTWQGAVRNLPAEPTGRFDPK